VPYCAGHDLRDGAAGGAPRGAAAIVERKPHPNVRFSECSTCRPSRCWTRPAGSAWKA
jgi:hypothetical protein